MDSVSLKKSVGMWFALAAFIMIVNAAFIYASFQKLDTQKRSVEHTYEVITNLEGAIAALLDVQAAQRGYVITGMQDYLAPYTIARPKVHECMETLSRLVADNPQQHKRLQALQGEIDQRIEIAETIIHTYEEKGQQAAFEIIKTGAGKRQMDEIRAGINEMVAEEEELLRIRQQRVDHAAGVTLYAGAVGLGLCLFILGFVFFLIRREMQHREAAESALSSTLAETRKISNDNIQLSQVADYLQGCQDVDEAFAILAANLPHLLPGTNGAIALFNNSRNLVKTMGSWGDYKVAEEEYSPEDCWALRRGQIHYVSPSGAEPACAHVGHHAPGGSVCYPMQAHGETLGLFYVDAEDEKALSDDGRALIRRVSEQASLAISNLKLREKLRDQSIRDTLTRLFNRRYLEETLEREMSRSRRTDQPLSLMVLDLDHFKRYNDTMGHDAGDALLVQFAALLQKNVRKEDIACRYGGEEFVIVLPMTDLELAGQRAQEIIDATRNMQVKLKNGDTRSVTVSIGVAVFPKQADSAEDLITRADKALYLAKNEGRDRMKLAA
ncbi:MAG TPA: diguanylate cyclase [Alphaproteobacteria bacterium]|nr:diguanylate cyclase [Alphaproteobacteria bacterium]